MQDIRKPYSHSKSNHLPSRSLSSRVEDFENNDYTDEDDIIEIDGPVHIPTRSSRTRRNIDDMDMYPRRGEGNSRDDINVGGPVYRDLILFVEVIIFFGKNVFT